MNNLDLDDLCEQYAWDSERIINRLAEMVGELQEQVADLERDVENAEGRISS